MAAQQFSPGRLIFWGAVTAALYWVLYHYAEEFIRLAHVTVNACAVQEGGQTTYFTKATPDLCAAKGGEYVPGNWLFVLVPIIAAFAISYTHGLFTGLFWDAVGLKPANGNGKK